MAKEERSKGLYTLLGLSAFYEASQNFVGAPAAMRRFVSEFATIEPGFNVLDLGAGTGGVETYLTGCTYTAIEPNPNYVAKMQSRFAGTEHTALLGGAPDFPQIDQQFDRVIIMGVLHHVDDTVASQMIEYASTKLVPGGEVITLDPVKVPKMPLVAKAVMGMDRGRHIRTPQGYRALAGSCFGNIDVQICPDLLKIPYRHHIMRLTAPIPQTVPACGSSSESSATR